LSEIKYQGIHPNVFVHILQSLVFFPNQCHPMALLVIFLRPEAKPSTQSLLSEHRLK